MVMIFTATCKIYFHNIWATNHFITMQRNFFRHQQSAEVIITNHTPIHQRIRMYSSHLDPKVQAAHIEILQAQADRRVPLHQANHRIRLPSRERPTKIATEPPGSGRGEAEFGRPAAYLDVLGLEPVDELAEEIPELAEREEQPVAKQRGQRRRVRQPHHLAPSLIPPGSPPLVPETPPRALPPREFLDFSRKARIYEFES